jgi:hypothetical protein
MKTTDNQHHQKEASGGGVNYLSELATLDPSEKVIQPKIFRGLQPTEQMRQDELDHLMRILNYPADPKPWLDQFKK